MIKIEGIRLMQNYVLVQTQEDYENYQIKGRDTGIIAGLDKDSVGQRMSVFGKVVATCDSLSFNRDLIKKAKLKYGSDAQKEVDRLKRSTVLYDVPMELRVGDEVMYFYKNQLDCYQDGRVFHTDQGTMMLMRYDQLRAVVKAEDQLYPLNGRVFIKPVHLKTDEETSTGIYLMKQKHMGMDIKNKTSYGIVVEAGCYCDGYVDFPNAKKDLREELNTGDYIVYDARMSQNLEFETHQTLKTKRVILHRKDIYMKLDDPSRFEFID